jgi:hypothetical protein
MLEKTVKSRKRNRAPAEEQREFIHSIGKQFHSSRLA